MDWARWRHPLLLTACELVADACFRGNLVVDLPPEFRLIRPGEADLQEKTVAHLLSEDGLSDRAVPPSGVIIDVLVARRHIDARAAHTTGVAPQPQVATIRELRD